MMFKKFALVALVGGIVGGTLSVILPASPISALAIFGICFAIGWFFNDFLDKIA
jgi:hypothetical protein